MSFSATGVLIDRGDGVLIPIQPVTGPGIPGSGVVMAPPPAVTSPPPPPSSPPPTVASTTQPASATTAPQQTATTALTPTVVVSSDGDALVPPSVRVPQGYLGFYSRRHDFEHRRDRYRLRSLIKQTVTQIDQRLIGLRNRSRRHRHRLGGVHRRWSRQPSPTGNSSAPASLQLGTRGELIRTSGTCREVSSRRRWL